MQNYGSNSSEFVFPDEGSQLIRVNFLMGKKSLQYERSVGKIANVLSDVGGLYTSIFGTFSIVILIYYNHKLRLKLAENMFKKTKSSVKKSDYGFFNSLAYGLSGILKPRQTSNYGKDCKRVEKNLNEVDSLMHIEFILKRL